MARRAQQPVGAVVAIATLALGLAACTGGEFPPNPTVSASGSWGPQIAQVLSDPDSSEFERRVLADYRVTDEEYKEARGLFSQCMADLGWVVEDGADGGYLVYGAPDAGHDDGAGSGEASNKCANGSTRWIEPIYLGMQNNPQGLTAVQRIRSCYEHHGVPDGAGLSGDQFDQLINAPDYHPSTPDGVLCFWDPTGAAGLTVEEAQRFENNKTTVALPETTAG